MPVTLKIISNTRAQVEGEPSERALRALDEALSWVSPKAKFANAAKWAKFRNQGWDGKTHLFNKVSMTFPLGLLDAATEALESHGVRCAIRDDRPVHHRGPGLVGVKLLDPRPDHTGERLELREYQAAAIATAHRAERGILKVATGGGKTPITAGLAQAFGRKGHPAKTVILLHKRALARQTQRELAKMLGEPVGLIAEGKWHEEQVTVAIIDTFASKKFKKLRLRLNKACELLVLDEAHRAGSKKWSRTARNIKAPFRFGLSGTPLDRGDGKDILLIAITGEIIYTVKSKDLIKEGFLAKPLIKFREIHEPGGLDDCDFDTAYKHGVVYNKHFHKAVRKDVREALARDDKVLVLVQRLDHGEILSEILDAPFVHYKTDAEVTDRRIAELERGDIRVLVASPIFREGINIPSVDALVMADGGKTIIGTLQKVGRALRPKKGKPNTCVIYDYAHFTNSYLLEHGLTRLNTYKLEGFVVSR